MRQSLKELIDSTIIYQYSIPHVDKKIDGIDLCNYEDDCYDYSSDENLVELIYKGTSKNTICPHHILKISV